MKPKYEIKLLERQKAQFEKRIEADKKRMKEIAKRITKLKKDAGED